MSYEANERTNSAGRDHEDAKPVSLGASGQTGEVSCALEGFEAQLRNVSRTSRVALGRVRVANDVIEVETLEFSGQNVFALVAAGGWSSPSRNLGRAGFIGEGVFGFDVVDGLPAEGSAVERIYHNDTFVEDFNLWVDESQPGESSQNHNHSGNSEGYSLGGVENRLDQVQEVQQNHKDSHENSGLWSENVSIGHLPIVAGAPRIPMVEGK